MNHDPTLTLDQAGLEPREDADRVQRRALVIGLVGLAATALGYFMAPETFFRGYLVAWLLWLGVAAGLLALCMLNHVAGGRWGVLLRRVFEASGRTLPLFLVLGIPLALGVAEIYPWAREGAMVGDPLLQHKAPWLNVTGWTVRGIAYLAIWSFLGWRLSSLSRRFDETGEPGLRVAMQRWSAGGLIVYMLTGTFASVDWVMSLDPHWFSSLFGAAFVVGHGLGALAFSVLMLVFLSRRKPLNGLVHRERVHDYGKLMLAFTMLWAYLTVSQYLIIWSGNLPEEIIWYIERNTNGWKVVSVLLVVFHFALPFLVLLQRAVTQYPRRLVWVAVWVLAARWLDYYWQVVPSLAHEGPSLSPWDLLAPVGIGGIWVATLFWQLKERPLLPVREPILQEVLAHG